MIKLIYKALYRSLHKVFLHLYIKTHPNRVDTRLYCRYCKKLICIFYGQKIGEVSNAWHALPVKRRISYPYPKSVMINQCCDRKGKPIIREVKISG